MNWLGLAALAWDLSGGDDPQWDHDFIRKCILENHAGPTLDVGCGTGRLLLRYLEHGLDVEGVDPSPDMLAICRQKAAARNLQPILYQQTLQGLDLPHKFSVIFVACGTFMLITDPTEIWQALTRSREHLLPGGILLLSTYWPLAPGQLLSSTSFAGKGFWKEWFRSLLPDGSEIIQHIREIKCDPVEQVMYGERRYSLMHKGRLVREETYALNERWYFRNEMKLLLEQAGFVDIQIKGDYSDQDFSAAHTMMVSLARKPL